jgi:hypothetical protein
MSPVSVGSSASAAKVIVFVMVFLPTLKLNVPFHSVSM